MAVTIADKFWSGWSPFSGGAGSGRVSTRLLVGGQPDRNGYSPLMVTPPLTRYIDDAVHPCQLQNYLRIGAGRAEVHANDAELFANNSAIDTCRSTRTVLADVSSNRGEK
jgi:hypothetical protein